MNKEQKSHYPPGLEPIDFKKVGRIILVLGITTLVIEAFLYITALLTIPLASFIFSLAFSLVGLYLIVFVPSRK